LEPRPRDLVGAGLLALVLVALVVLIVGLTWLNA
jgi:hypothetical protein